MAEQGRLETGHTSLIPERSRGKRAHHDINPLMAGRSHRPRRPLLNDTSWPVLILLVVRIVRENVYLI